MSSQAAQAALEGRQHARLDLQIEVDINSEHNFYTGFTRNISEGGLFIATSQIIDMGSILEFKFTLHPDPEPILVKGKVRWVRELNEFTDDMPCGMGIQFIDLDPHTQSRIDRFIEQLRDSLFYDD
ncbi:MAG: TIGR02266 family protein [Bradymonadia bacterium]